jgi:hypothetical protein
VLEAVVTVIVPTDKLAAISALLIQQPGTAAEAPADRATLN